MTAIITKRLRQLARYFRQGQSVRIVRLARLARMIRLGLSQSIPAGTKSITLPVIVAVNLVTLLSSPVIAKDKSEAGWTLVQRSLLQGDQELIACKYGVKLTALRGGQTYLFARPYSQVQVWSVKTGKYCTIPIKSYKSQIQTAKNLFDTQSLETTPLKKIKEGVFNGLATVEYSETPEFQKRQQQRFATKEAPARIPKSIHYIVSNKFTLDPTIYRCVSTFYGFPYTEAMPLSLISYDMDHDRKTQLITAKITNSKFSPEQFTMPTGLKLVADEHKMAETADYNEAIEMMLPGKNK